MQGSAVLGCHLSRRSALVLADPDLAGRRERRQVCG
jgi:hypothetical protein